MAWSVGSLCFLQRLMCESRMKYFCFGFFDEAALAQIPQADAQTMRENCLAYDDLLRQGGHVLAGEALDSPQNAVTLRMKDGALQVTDSPFVETKDPLGSILLLEARDLNHAIALMSKHPALKIGKVFEIRPAIEEMNRLVFCNNDKIE